ncbi:zinc finger BED domain-containing protein RICESLEEPER 2-like [Arachis stenosperma]|uniref:zinc finger BED domain-containing protein RICESLEEPER 2-like n=1 Tax=Arachis stenosperma TaxID=217475 RepID=UPI0025AB76B6|nr:zinc finger BED domain-containing protein RICESLEEPER 2-like [Arachis stenosperma]
MAAVPVPAGTRPAPTRSGRLFSSPLQDHSVAALVQINQCLPSNLLQFRESFKPPVPVAPPPLSSSSRLCHLRKSQLVESSNSSQHRSSLCHLRHLRSTLSSRVRPIFVRLVFSNYFMASNAREDTQSNSVAPNDNEVEVQSNANPTSETPQATDNVSTPEGSTPNEGDNKTHVKSAYWEYFDRLKVEGEWKAKCKFCKTVLSANPRNGTKSLRNHVDRYCKRIKVANSRQSSIVESLSKQSQKQKLSEDGFVFDPSFTRKCVAEMIILHEYPMSCVDHHGLRRAFASMQPTFKMPSRNTIRKDILKMYGDEKQKLTLQLDENDSRVAITTDMWTSNQEKGYMVVTAHFIDTSWKLHMRILSFCYVPCPHTSEVLTETLMKILLEWNIDRKLSTITLDNCSTNDAMIDGLLGRLDSSFLMLGGKLLHMRCCAHILNLIVKDGLSIVKESIEKIRSSVLYWTATQKRTETFVSWCAKTAISFTRKLVLDCPTRWNSTYLMLETALLYKAVFPRLRQKEPQYKTVPSNEEWELAKEICDRLKLFYDVTQLFSGSKFPTANLYFTLVCKIKVSLDEWEISTNPLIANMASNMKKKFEKYWDEIHGIMGVAAVLDPRYKMVGVEFQFEKMYPDPTECSKQVDRIHQLCNELVNEYTQKMSSDVSHVSVGVGTKELNESGNASSFGGDDYMVYLKRRKMTRSSYVNVELDHYLEEEIHPPNDPNFNVLKWWKNNQMKFKVLAKIAKDIYAIPVSTVASESAFSTSGRVISPHRAKLKQDIIEALMCGQSWLWAPLGSKGLNLDLQTFNDDEDVESDQE